MGSGVATAVPARLGAGATPCPAAPDGPPGACAQLGRPVPPRDALVPRAARRPPSPWEHRAGSPKVRPVLPPGAGLVPGPTPPRAEDEAPGPLPPPSLPVGLTVLL